MALSYGTATLYCFRPITKLIQANRELIQKDLSQAMSSHELKTPMQGIKQIRANSFRGVLRQK